MGAAPSSILALTGSGFRQLCGLRGPIMHQYIQFQHNPAMQSWVIDERANFWLQFLRDPKKPDGSPGCMD